MCLQNGHVINVEERTDVGLQKGCVGGGGGGGGVVVVKASARVPLQSPFTAFHQFFIY